MSVLPPGTDDIDPVLDQHCRSNADTKTTPGQCIIFDGFSRRTAWCTRMMNKYQNIKFFPSATQIERHQQNIIHPTAKNNTAYNLKTFQNIDKIYATTSITIRSLYFVTIIKWTKPSKTNIGKKRVNPYSAGIDFSRQNLTSVDVRF